MRSVRILLFPGIPEVFHTILGFCARVAYSGVKFAYSKGKHMHIADAIEVFVRLKKFLFDWRQEVLFDFAAQSEERLFAVGEIPLVELELEEGVFA